MLFLVFESSLNPVTPPTTLSETPSSNPSVALSKNGEKKGARTDGKDMEVETPARRKKKLPMLHPILWGT